MKQAALLLVVGVAWARPPKAPEPPVWMGPATLSVVGVRAEDALVRSRLAVAPGATGLLVRVRALDAEQPLGTFEHPIGETLRLRGLPAGTWAVESATVQAGAHSRWSDPLVVEVQALADGVQTVLEGADPGLPAGEKCTVGGQPFWRPAAGDHAVNCVNGTIRLQVVAATASWAGPAVVPRGTPVNVQIKLAGGPAPAVADLVLGGRAWPLRVVPGGLEGQVVVPPGVVEAVVRDPDVPDGPPLAVVALPAGGAK